MNSIRKRFQCLLIIAAAGVALLAPSARAQSNGSSISPFTLLFEWNRANTDQFTKTDIPNPSGIAETLYTTQPSTAYSVTPMLKWTGPSSQYRYLLTTDTYSPTADEDLVIEADVGGVSDSNEKNGVGCFDPQNPTSNFYVLTRNSSGYWQLNKYIGGTLYVQTGGVQSGYAGDGLRWKMRVRFVVTNAGGVRIHIAGMTVMDVPMTMGNSTVLTSCKAGLVLYPYNTQYMSNLRVFRMKPEGEQLF